MIEALAGPIEAGRVKVYAVDSFDSGSWYRGDLPLEERARLHGRYEDWILNQVAPFIQADSRRRRDRRHRRQLRRLPRGQLRAQARAPLPARDLPERRLRRLRRRRAASAATPSTSTTRRTTSPHLGGDHLDWLRGRVNLLLLCGQGAWEDSTGALESTRRFADQLGEKGIRARARRLGPRRPARLAGVARADRASSASIPMTQPHSPIGLLLGTEEDWPTAFEHLLGRVGPISLRRRDARARRGADHERAVRPPLEAALPARDRPARLVVHGAARVAEEGLADGRRLPAEQPVHVPGDGEALRLLRDDAARPPRAGDLADPAQEPARERALRAHRGALQPPLRARGDRRRRSATRST